MSFVDNLQNKVLRNRLRQFSNPVTRKDADKVLKLVTDENVAELGREFRDTELYDLQLGPFNMAACLVAHAAAQGNPEAPGILMDLALRLRDNNVSKLHPSAHPSHKYDGTWRYRYWNALSLFPDVPAAVAAHAILDDLFTAMPKDDLLLWAEEIGLDLPTGRTWGLQIHVPGERLKVKLHLSWWPEKSMGGYCAIEPDGPWHGDRIEVWKVPHYGLAPAPDSQRFALDQRNSEDNWVYEGYDLVPGPGVSAWQPSVVLEHPFTGPWDLKTYLDDLERATGYPMHRKKAKVYEARGHKSAPALRAWLVG